MSLINPTPKDRRTCAYFADGGLVGGPDFLALGSAAVGKDLNDGVLIGACGQE